MAIDLSNQQALDADPKAIQPTIFTGNPNWCRNANTIMFFIVEELIEAILDFSKGALKAQA